MEYIFITLFILFVIGIIACAIAMILYLKFTKDYYSIPEDKTGLYDFISIKDNIINVNHIVNIKQIKSTKEDNFSQNRKRGSKAGKKTFSIFYPCKLDGF